MADIKSILKMAMEEWNTQSNMFAGLDRAVKGLTAGQAAWKDDETDNSIQEIVHHLIFWNSRWLARFMGLPVEDAGEFSNESTFFKDQTAVQPDKALWEGAVEKLKQVHIEWIRALEECDEEMLLTSESSERLRWEKIMAMNLHSAHHLGQIILIRKRQGSWEPVDWD
ncbi:DinB family protein [Peribacillus sp. SCS-37]|uniref:DinB family protein n=1 Tax=Paraperibacillus esterisolvens TaxID=3115296 RepID=UPI003906CDEB